MPVPKANQRAVNKYVKNNYDRINVTMPKGKKDIIQARAEAQGQSVNGFINAAIDAQMGKPSTNPVEAPITHDKAGVVSLPSGTLKAAQEAAEAAGEDVPQFLDRAVTTQAQRDEMARKLGLDPATGGKLEKEA